MARAARLPVRHLRELGAGALLAQVRGPGGARAAHAGMSVDEGARVERQGHTGQPYEVPARR
eukprot:7516363-Alexandrium_andersonii.AAC.1